MQLQPLKRFLMRHLSYEQQVALRRLKHAAFPTQRMPGPPTMPVGSVATNAGATGGPAGNYGLATDESTMGLLWPWNYEVSRLPPLMPSGRPWPRISVVTVSYNQGMYIEETIRSVLLQGYPNLEYIVVDANSTDNTPRVLDRYRGEIAHVIQEPDNGQSDALNKGFKRATGDILAWLNSDDQYFPDTLRKVAEAFDRHQTDLVVGGTTLLYDYGRAPAGTHHCVFDRDKVTPLPLDKLADFNGQWQQGKYFFQPEVFWTRELWERSGARVEGKLRYAMDYELWLRFASKGARLVHIPDQLALFRVHAAQKTKWREGEDYPEHVAVGRTYAEAAGATIVSSERADAAAPNRIQDTIPKSIFDRRPVVLCRTPAGEIHIPADGFQDEACKAMRAGELYRRELLEEAVRHVRPGTLVLDVGAGVGQSSLHLAKALGPDGQVFAFEADPYLFDILLKNIDTNHAENVRAFRGVVFDGSRQEIGFPRLEHLRFPSYSTQTVDRDATGGPRSRTLTVDELGVEAPVSLMLVHAPGSEAEVLAGARATIGARRMPILVETDDPRAADEASVLVRAAAELGYRVERTLHGSALLLLPTQPATSGATEGRVYPQVRQSPTPFRNSLCKVLKSRAEVDECTDWLKRNGYVSHNLVCKDWDIAHIVAEIGDGNFLDMGSSDSYVLKNVCIKRRRGERYGIDFNEPDVPLSDVKYMIGDLMDTKLPSGHFSYITCLSVLEHQVDYDRFAAEVSRLLQPGGKLFVTFDYWNPRLTPPVKLYGLEWQPLDEARARDLFAACERQGLSLVQPFDPTQGEPVIRWGYYSPHPDMSYTFALAVLTKR
jgi:FkbM family methyltransferase